MLRKKEYKSARPVAQPKFKFTLEIDSEEWDYNRDLAVGDSWEGDCWISKYVNEPNFANALSRLIADHIFGKCEHAFKKVRLTNLVCDPECEKSFQELRQQASEKKRASEEEQLIQLQAERARIDSQTKELKKKLRKSDK